MPMVVGIDAVASGAPSAASSRTALVKVDPKSTHRILVMDGVRAGRTRAGQPALLASARSRSSMRSSTFSIPVDRRTRSAGTSSSVPRTEA